MCEYIDYTKGTDLEFTFDNCSESRDKQKPVHHFLKTDSALFEASISGKRNYEIRKNDRDYQPSEYIILVETVYSGYEMKCIGRPLQYTGSYYVVKIDSVLTGYGLKDGWVIMAVSKVSNMELSNYLARYDDVFRKWAEGEGLNMY